VERSVIVALIIVLLLLALGIFIKNSNESIVAGDNTEQIVLNNLKICCSYFENGEEKTCSILEKYDCSLCSVKCG